MLSGLCLEFKKSLCNLKYFSGIVNVSACSYIFTISFIVILKFQTIYFPTIFDHIDDKKIIIILRLICLGLPVIITFFEFGLITDVKDFVIYNLLCGNVNEKIHIGLITSFLSGCLLLVWLLIQMKIEFDNYKQLHTSLLNFNLITSHERSFGFFCLLVSVLLLIFVQNVFPHDVGYYPTIVMIRLVAIDFMLIAFISKSSKIKNFICTKLVPNQQIICVIE